MWTACLWVTDMKTSKGRTLYVFDNQGRTLDQYTIIFTNGDVYTASKNPFDKDGYGKKGLNIIKSAKFTDKVREYVRTARVTPQWLGKEVLLYKRLPKEVRKYIETIRKETGVRGLAGEK